MQKFFYLKHLRVTMFISNKSQQNFLPVWFTCAQLLLHCRHFRGRCAFVLCSLPHKNGYSISIKTKLARMCTFNASIHPTCTDFLGSNCILLQMLHKHFHLILNLISYSKQPRCYSHGRPN